jgi:hypothetical protein
MNNNLCNACNSPVTDGHKCVCGVSCISWSAILIGALFILGLSFLLNVFSATIGLSAFHLSSEGVKTLAVGGFVGMLVGTIAVMFFSGWVAGYLGRTRCVTGYCGSVYGFSSWSVALIVTILLSAHVGKFVTSFNDFAQTPTYSNVAVTTNNAAPVVSTNNANPSQLVVNSDKVAMGAFAIFILFLVGAFSSAIGGHCGLRTCCKKDRCQHNVIDKDRSDRPSGSM